MKTISFREDMIDLIISGKKTLTIRPIKPQPVRVEVTGLFGSVHYEWREASIARRSEWFLAQCPYGLIGDIISVREKRSLRIKITNKYVRRVDQLTTPDWADDGLGYGKTVYKHWQSFYGGTEYDWKNKPYVWVIRFEVTK